MDARVDLAAFGDALDRASPERALPVTLALGLADHAPEREDLGASLLRVDHHEFADFEPADQLSVYDFAGEDAEDFEDAFGARAALLFAGFADSAFDGDRQRGGGERGVLGALRGAQQGGQ